MIGKLGWAQERKRGQGPLEAGFDDLSLCYLEVERIRQDWRRGQDAFKDGAFGRLDHTNCL